MLGPYPVFISLRCRAPLISVLLWNVWPPVVVFSVILKSPAGLGGAVDLVLDCWASPVNAASEMKTLKQKMSVTVRWK